MTMAGHESILETPRHVVKAEMVLPPGVAPARPIEIQPPTEEQALATDEYFAQTSDPEAQAVMGLLGMWTGTLVLNDILAEHLRPSTREDEDETKPLPPFQKDRDREEQ